MREDGEPILTEETISHVSKLFREHGSNIWFEREAKELLPEGFTHPVVQMVSLRKKKILWMFGLIRVHLIKVF